MYVCICISVYLYIYVLKMSCLNPVKVVYDFDGKWNFIYSFILGLNPHNFAKNYPNFENKELFYAKFYGA